MTERVQKNELVRQLAGRMQTDEATADGWLEGVVGTLYDNFKAGKSVTLPGFGSFYVRPEDESWVFKFTPAEKLRALLVWSSTYKGEI
jgi:nucleoid DNA-binding protein